MLFAPISIYTKAEELKKIYEALDDSTDVFWKEYCSKVIENIEIAIRLLNDDGVFL